MPMSKVLIVDDDLPFVNLLREALIAYRQYEVVTATDKSEVATALEEKGISLVILDIDAASIDTIGFLSSLSIQYPRIPAIVMTRRDASGAAAIDRCVSAGFILRYMAKPANLQVVGSAILAGLDRCDEDDFASGIPPVGLLHILAVRQITGAVRVSAGRFRQGFLYVDRGIPVDASYGDQDEKNAFLEIMGWCPVNFELAEFPREVRPQTIVAEMLDSLFVVSNCGESMHSFQEGGASIAGVDRSRIIKLFIVDDSRMMRTVVKNIFAEDKSVDVVGEATNGEEALNMLPQLQPDVITLDVQMPVMNGITTLKHIMIKQPCPTVMLSAFTREGAEVTFDALKLGAVDFVAKPSNTGDLDLQEQARDILRKVHLAADVELGAVRFIRTAKKGKKKQQGGGVAAVCNRLVVMGAAEGGYGSLLKIIPYLETEPAFACLVMLHAAPEHVDAFVDYLDNCSFIAVQRARNGAFVQEGRCYIASGREYLTIRRVGETLEQHLSAAPFSTMRGAVNMLMFSAAEVMGDRTTGLVLSGLGEDGAEGLEEIVRVGGSALVQCPASCLYKEMAEAALRGSPQAMVLTDREIAAELKSERAFRSVER